MKRSPRNSRSGLADVPELPEELSGAVNAMAATAVAR